MITVNSLKPAFPVRITWFNIQEFYVLRTQCIYKFRTYLRKNIDLCPTHEPIGFCNPREAFTARYELNL